MIKTPVKALSSVCAGVQEGYGFYSVLECHEVFGHLDIKHKKNYIMTRSLMSRYKADCVL